MSEESKNEDDEVQIVCNAESYKLNVTIKLESESGNELAGVDTEATIPFLLMEEHLLLAEPRVRQQLDSLVSAFKLLCASKINNLIEASKANEPQVVHNSADPNQDVQDFPEVDDDEI